MRLLEDFSAFMRAGWGAAFACAATQLTPVIEVLSVPLRIAVSAFAAMDRVHGRLPSWLEVVSPSAILLPSCFLLRSRSRVVLKSTPVTAHRYSTRGKGNKPQSQIRHTQSQEIPCSSRGVSVPGGLNFLQLVLPPQPSFPGFRSS
ncbi:hypothetical protein K456DRAFT_1151151 [Colletotrichum gloeosporioides 23]|nr:hypothetical protein K456DRAFT_1151151 [Colletotrichum gloeosporioides 23]